MRIIYHGDGHRGARSMVLEMAGGAFLVAIWVGSLIYDGYRNHLALIGLLLVGFVAWIARCAFKFYALVPVNVSILDSGAIRFQSRGHDQTYSADQIRISLTSTGMNLRAP